MAGEDTGSLLVRAGLIADEQLLLAREARQKGGGTIGEHLVLAGYVGDEELTQFLHAKLMVPRVDPDQLGRITQPLVARIPGDLATELRIMPIALDGEGNLTLAMSDPNDQKVIDEIGFFTGNYIVRAVATQLQIAWCLAHYYGHVTQLARRMLVKPSADPAASPAGSLAEAAARAAARAEHRRAAIPLDLPPRSGELQAQPEPSVSQTSRLPAVVVEDLDPGDTDRSVELGTESQPILLGRTSAAMAAPPVEIVEIGPDGVQVRAEVAPGDSSDDVLMLDKKRRGRDTEVGLGRLGTGDEHLEAEAERARRDTNPNEPDRGRRKKSSSDVDRGWADDGWGPPGTTIPPPYLGAIPGTYDDLQSGAIPIPVGEDPSGVVSPDDLPSGVRPVPAEDSRATLPGSAPIVDDSATLLLRALRELDLARSRDAVVDAVLGFVAAATPRCGFLALKGDRLTPFRLRGAAPGPGLELTVGVGLLADAIGRAVGVRGEAGDDDARAFLAQLFGHRVDQVLAQPVVVRARVVGLLVVDDEARRIVDEHLAVAARAAGLALERVLAHKR